MLIAEKSSYFNLITILFAHIPYPLEGNGEIRKVGSKTTILQKSNCRSFFRGRNFKDTANLRLFNKKIFWESFGNERKSWKNIVEGVRPWTVSTCQVRFWYSSFTFGCFTKYNILEGGTIFKNMSHLTSKHV